MPFTLHTTCTYHRAEGISLGWELTVCNALDPPESLCRKVLRRPDSYGNLLYDYLSRFFPIGTFENILEIGGGYGCLMRDFLNRNRRMKATMLDISRSLLERQRETLQGCDVTYIETDFLEASPAMLTGMELAILNENLGDFPTLLDVERRILEEPAKSLSKPLTRAVELIKDYGLPLPQRDPFHFNIGAVEAVEKLCRAAIPFIFLGEHSCEAAVPEPYRSCIEIKASGNPERIPLMGHDEYTIKFSHLEAVARSLGYRIIRGPFADFLNPEITEKVRVILASPWSTRDDHEIILQFMADLYQYEHLVLIRETGSRA